MQGFDPFMNLVTDERMGMATSRQQNNTGMVVIHGKVSSCQQPWNE